MGSFISTNNVSNNNNSTTIEFALIFNKSDNFYYCTMTVKNEHINFIVDIPQPMFNEMDIPNMINRMERVCINLDNCCIFYEPDSELLTYEMWAGHDVSTEVECHITKEQMIDAVKSTGGS